ncbi:GntR family transcriptional regulator [Muricoccus aerilatus]|uniref:GntR family transcriptional regulator n=1 Tax=Muricoccus aerilatus TaxID=452982 RepID=UPI0006950EA6|nr:GntR family transcriptional regulator [Roseomonas aerilata]
MPDDRLTPDAGTACDGAAAASSRVEHVTVKLREMIVTHALPAGARVPERDLAELLKVSRTPVRVALEILAAEGLVRGSPNRGFVVNAFSSEDILSAFQVRSMLEGFAARTAVERGLQPSTIKRLEACILEGEALVAQGRCDAEGMRRWSACNGAFHAAIVDAAGLSALGKVYDFTARMPLVSPVAILFTTDRRDDAYARMVDAHGDHLRIFDALRREEGDRADYLMREHGYRSRERLGELLRGEALRPVPPTRARPVAKGGRRER